MCEGFKKVPGVDIFRKQLGRSNEQNNKVT